MNKRFINRTALVTGAAKGIGAAVVRRLASEGAFVAINDINAAGAAALANELQNAGFQAIAVAADLSDATDTERMLKEAKEKLGGHIDILVNNAGGSCMALGRFVSFEEQTVKDIDWEFAVNLRSAIQCIQKVLPEMKEKNYGRIVNLSSICGTAGASGIPVYSASKGAIISITKSLAMMYGNNGITVNCVAPAAVATRPGMEKLGDSTVFGRPSSADDIANLICYLASDEAAFVTGQCHLIDGGRTLGPKAGKI